MLENVCLFVPFRSEGHTIHTINYVLETKPKEYKGLYTESVYKMHFICKGSGYIHSRDKITPISEGDIFFTFPSFNYAIESKKDFSYMYISFVGTRGNFLLEKLGISPSNFIVHDCGKLLHVWEDGLTVSPELSDLASESVLLRSFAHLGEKLNAFESAVKDRNSVALVIKKYIDDNFSDTDFSIDKISQELNYNKKYISAIFKKKFNVGIIDYLTTVRIQNACTMIRRGFTSVNDIAFCCGFSDAQYFSKVFKNRMCVSPMQYIKETSKPS